MEAYKHCFYDKLSKSIYLRTVADTHYKKIPYEKDYWVKDPTGKSPMKDLYGVPMIRKTKYDKKIVDVYKKANTPVAESDLKEEVKYMHSVYDNEKLEVDLSKWNFCLFDIETAGGGLYPDDYIVKYQLAREEKEIVYKKIDSRFIKLNPKVFDEKTKVWVEFNKSSLYKIEGFPYAEKAEVPINLITCWSSKTDQTYTWGLGHYTGDNPIVKNFRGFDDETALITDWLKWFDKQSFDLWSGWNSKLFDVPYIVNRIKNIRERLGIEKPIENKLSPVAKAPIRQDVTDRLTGSKRGETYDIPGLLHHDYMDLYVTFAKHDPLPSYSLNYVTNLELGEGKLEYEGTINTIYKENFNLFTEYNVQDVLLLVKLEKKLKLFALIIEYAYDCVTTLDKVFQKVPTTEGYILKFIHKQNKLMNDRKDHHTDSWHDEECYKVTTNGKTYYQNCYWEDGKYTFDEFAIKAGYCYDYPGRYDNCMSFDITSSYPHHIMQFNISPEVKVIHPTKEQIESGEVILSDINELGFKRTTDAILPNLVKMVFDERKHYKDLKKKAHKDGNKELEDLYDARQAVKKIIINSMYGVCLTSSFHLYDIDCARAITRCARVTLRDWLTGSISKYYPTKGFISDLEKEFGFVTITANGTEYKFGYNEKITIQRNGEEMKIPANQFNKETDLLGIED